ncbi:MAG: hypothetical protein ACE5H1_11995 [Thermodesulfobacteriota bacterium]
MEIIGKVLTLTILTIFGSAAAAVYLIDSEYFSPLQVTHTKKVSIPIQNIQEKKTIQPSTPLDKERKREPTRFFETLPPTHKLSSSSNRKMVWTQTYREKREITNYQYQEAKKLAVENSISTLMKKMNEWNSKYYTALNQPGRTSEANEAFMQFKKYKDALQIRRSLLSQSKY